jgi:hypothetical protein
VIKESAQKGDKCRDHFLDIGDGFVEKRDPQRVVVGRKFPEKVEFLRLTGGSGGLFCRSR